MVGKNPPILYIFLIIPVFQGGLTMEFPVHAGSDFHANPIWEAQSNFFSMAYGFFGVSMCAISMNGMDRSFIDEGIDLPPHH